MALTKNDCEGPCMCNPADLMNEAKGHDMLGWSMIKRGKPAISDNGAEKFGR